MESEPLNYNRVPGFVEHWVFREVAMEQVMQLTQGNRVSFPRGHVVNLHSRLAFCGRDTSQQRIHHHVNRNQVERDFGIHGKRSKSALPDRYDEWVCHAEAVEPPGAWLSKATLDHGGSHDDRRRLR